MPTLDARPGRLDGVYRPGSSFTVTLTGPADWLDSRVFTATLGGTALVVAEDGDDLIVTASAVVTAAHPSGAQDLVITQTGGNAEIVGKWVPRTSGSVHENTAATVVVDDLNVEVSILGVGTVTPADLTAAVNAAVTALLDGAPGALNTLNELAAALGDDANFAATVTTALAGKVPLSQHGTTLGDSTLDAGNLVTDIVTHWGVSGGVPYYEEDPDDVVAGEEAIMHVDETGAVTWVLLSDVEAKDTAVEVEAAARAAADATKQPLDADLTTVAGLTPSNDDLLQRKAGAWANRTPAQVKTDLVLVKGDVGLGNVDNTSDANKPVSTATQTALDAKLASASYTAADVLAKLLTVDGSGSGLDADLLDGLSSAVFLQASQSPWGFALGPVTADPVSGIATGSYAANRAVYMRVLGSGTISKIGMYVQTQSGNICVGVYANTGSGRSAVPGARQQTSGSVACPGTGYQEVALGGSVAVNHGDWFALAADNTTASFGNTSSAVLAGALWAGRSAYQDTAFPVPATATPTNGLIRGPILVGIA